MIQFLKLIFNISILFLILLSFFPGSLIGYLLYGDLSQQPYLIRNPFGTTINHFIAYFFVEFSVTKLFLCTEILFFSISLNFSI